MALLSSLGDEKHRWEAGSETFKQQMATIIGDVLLSAAFMAYAGYFDQQMRQNLFGNWCNHLHQAAIQYRPDLARTEVRIYFQYFNLIISLSVTPEALICPSSALPVCLSVLLLKPISR